MKAVEWDAIATALGHPLGVEEWSAIGQANQPSNPDFFKNSVWNAGRAGLAGGTAGGSEIGIGLYEYFDTGDADAFQQHMGAVAGANLAAAGTIKVGSAIRSLRGARPPNAPSAGLTPIPLN